MPAGAASAWPSSRRSSRISRERSGSKPRRGVGTRFIVELPVTLAITDALIARVGAETFAIPQGAVREVIEVPIGAIRLLEQNEIVPHRGAIVADRPARADVRAPGVVARPSPRVRHRHRRGCARHRGRSHRRPAGDSGSRDRRIRSCGSRAFPERPISATAMSCSSRSRGARAKDARGSARGRRDRMGEQGGQPMTSTPHASDRLHPLPRRGHHLRRAQPGRPPHGNDRERHPRAQRAAVCGRRRVLARRGRSGHQSSRAFRVRARVATICAAVSWSFRPADALSGLSSTTAREFVAIPAGAIQPPQESAGRSQRALPRRHRVDRRPAGAHSESRTPAQLHDIGFDGGAAGRRGRRAASV